MYIGSVLYTDLLFLVISAFSSIHTPAFLWTLSVFVLYKLYYTWIPLYTLHAWRANEYYIFLLIVEDE